MARLVIVGAGVIGTAVALAAVERGHSVELLERDQAPRGASVRNFGLLWICGRAPGQELELALAGRERWPDLAERAPSIGLRACGAVVVARHPSELALLEAACARADAEQRGVRMLTRHEVRTGLGSVGDGVVGGLHTPHDAVVEPGAVLGALRGLAGRRGGLRFLTRRTAVEVSQGTVVDHLGERHEGDLTVLCCGGPPRVLGAAVDDSALETVCLQMLEVEAGSTQLEPALADGGALRYYPAFDLPERAALAPPDPLVETHGIQLLAVRRARGTLTVGDTHRPPVAGAFALEDAPEAHLLAALRAIVGGDPGRVLARWGGRYVKRVDGRAPYLSDELAPGVVTVCAAGGHGMTGAPEIAARELSRLGL
jgi:FAD dependent oxidoreductase TIGR03364